MARGTTTSETTNAATTRRERGSRASGRAESAARRERGAATARRSSTTNPEDDALVTAALMGAAVGAGLGFLLSRMFAEEPTAGAVIRIARDRAVKRGRRQVARVADQIHGAGRQARDAFDDLLDREVKSLRKVAQRQRRRFGL